MYKIILASQSPRRRELLSAAGIKFRTDLIEISEMLNENMNLDEAISLLAWQKVEAYLESVNYLKSQDYLVIGADTLVELNGVVLGKPKDEDQAFDFLSRLSGRLHSVKTGVCIFNSKTQRKLSHTETTQVYFRKLTADEISAYIQSGEPMDKAGAYGIQGSAGAFVEKIEGDFDSVVGLPVQWVLKTFEENNWEVEREQL